MRTIEDAIHALAARGFIRMRGPGDRYVPHTLIFTFAWAAPFMDAVHLRAEHAEHDATATRARTDKPETLSSLFAEDDDGPLLSGEDWWKGEFVSVVEKLLALRPPSEPGQQVRLSLTPSGLWIPGRGVA
jgi:hypothetical protein